MCDKECVKYYNLLQYYNIIIEEYFNYKKKDTCQKMRIYLFVYFLIYILYGRNVLFPRRITYIFTPVVFL